MGHMDRSRSGAEETDVSITPPKTWVVGVPAVANALRCSLEQMERTTTGTAGATATAPLSDGP